MTALAPVHPLTSIRLVGRGVLIELLRKKGLYVVLMLMGVFALGVGVMRFVGIKEAATATFLLNLGLTLAGACAHVLTLVVAARQLPDEIEKRTIYPLLAQPLERGWLLAGKWAACAASGMGCFLALFALSWICVPKLEPCSALLLVQTLALQMMSLALLAALALTLSLLAPKGVNLILLGLLVFFGGKLIAFLQARAGDEWFHALARWLTNYLPDFGKLNTITRYTDGVGPLGAGEFLGLLIYAAVLTAFTLALGAWIFQRRAL